MKQSSKLLKSGIFNFDNKKIGKYGVLDEI